MTLARAMLTLRFISVVELDNDRDGASILSRFLFGYSIYTFDFQTVLQDHDGAGEDAEHCHHLPGLLMLTSISLL